MSDDAVAKGTSGNWFIFDDSQGRYVLCVWLPDIERMAYIFLDKPQDESSDFNQLRQALNRLASS